MSALLAALLVLAPSARAERAVAGSVVRSKEWIVRRTPGHEEEEFSGDVRYESGDNRLAADWALYRKASRNWQAKGNVSLRRRLKDGALIEAAGDQARFSERDQSGRLESREGGLVRFRREPADGGAPDLGEGSALSWQGESGVLENAHVWGPRLELWASRALYERPEDRLTLEGGRPVLVKLEGSWITALKADRIVADDSPRRVAAAGAVRGWLVFKNEKALLKRASR